MKPLAYFSRSRAISFENLESRFALAGDVQVAVNGGNFVVTGDGEGNGITIAQTVDAGGALVAGSYTVTGTTQATAATTVNGETTAQTFTDVTGHLIVNAGGGDDNVVITNGTAATIQSDIAAYFAGTALSASPATNVNFTEDVKVNLGDGVDSFAVDGVDIAGHLRVTDTAGDSSNIALLRATVAEDVKINTGDGDDAFAAVQTDVEGRVNLTTGDGADHVNLGDFSAKAILAITAGGDDSVHLDAGTIDRELVILTGSGEDNVSLGDREVNVGTFDTTVGRHLVVDTGSGTDTVIAGGVDVHAHASFTTGADSDVLTLSNLNIGKHFFAALAGGFDTATITDVTVGRHAVVLSGSESDFITLRRVAVTDHLFAELGSGSDSLRLDTTSATRALLFGGDGADTFASINNTIGSVKRFNIETETMV